MNTEMLVYVYNIVLYFTVGMMMRNWIAHNSNDDKYGFVTDMLVMFFWPFVSVIGFLLYLTRFTKGESK